MQSRNCEVQSAMRVAFDACLICALQSRSIDAARDSGLLKSTHPNATQSRPFIKQVADKAKPIAAAAVRLVKGAPGQSQSFLKDLQAKVADLKSFLEKNPPAKPVRPRYPVRVRKPS